MTAQVIDLAAVLAGGVHVRPLSQAQIDAEVAAIRAELRRPLERLALLREAGAHLTTFGPGTAWHTACERWFGDLTELRLTGTAAAIEERQHLIWSLREEGASTRQIRQRLGVGARAVAEALTLRDPAPERVVSVDGSSRAARTGRRDPVDSSLRKWQQAAEHLRRAPDGLTISGLARVGGWSEGSASGLLSDLRRRGLAVRTEETRSGMRVHRAVTA